MDQQRRKKVAAAVSVASNSLLVILKLIIGWLIGSVSVLSEAVHSGVDLVAACIALFAVRTSHRPADAKHPFGHGKIENISGTIEAVLIFVAAGWIIYEAVEKLRHPQPLDRPGWGVLVMGVSAGLNIVVSRMLFRVGRQTGSVALEADAWHLRTDVWTSFGVMAALGLIWAGRRLVHGMNLHWMDPAVAIGVAALIMRAAYDLTRQAGRDLLDAQLPPDEEGWIRDYLRSFGPDVYGYHGLRTRRSGNTRFLQFHLIVRKDLSVDDSHRITDVITSDIRSRLPGADVTIHVEPYDGRRLLDPQ